MILLLIWFFLLELLCSVIQDVQAIAMCLQNDNLWQYQTGKKIGIIIINIA